MDQLGEAVVDFEAFAFEDAAQADRLHQQQLGGSAVSAKSFQHRFQRGLDSLNAGRLLVDGFFGAAFDQVGKLIDQSDEELLFVGEVEVDAAFADAAFGDDLVQLGIVEALGAEDIERGI